MIATAYDELIEIGREKLDAMHELQAAGLLPLDGDFFPSVHYPPITMYPPATEEELFKTYQLPADGLFDIYAHIPFCHHKCVFCHYPVKLGELTAEKDRYLTALEKEIDLYRRRLGIDRIQARSILIGGGTPTYLSLSQMKRFLDFFSARVDLSQCTQYNYDVDPTTLVGPEGRERLKMMRDYGVNRLTIGVQSLDDQILKRMNRDHDAATAVESIEASREFGYQLDIEFIFGHPGQTLTNWIEVMQKAVTLGTEEIQLYRLKVVPYGDYEGPIKRLRQNRPTDVPTIEEAVMMKQIAITLLNRAGYHENLRRVYTIKPDYYSHYAHNQCCMLYDEIGLGLTAFSSLRDRFVLNTQSFDDYYRLIDAGRLPLNRGLVRDREQQLRWAIILPLKNRDIYKPAYQEVTGGASVNQIFRKKFEALKSFGLLYEDEEFLRLTPEGAFFADECVEQFHAPQYIPFPQSNYADGPLNPYLHQEP